MKRSTAIFWRLREVLYRVVYSHMTLFRQEATGQFPRRIHIGPRRVVWLQEDVIRWMQSKVDARRGPPTASKVVIGPEDRFISKKELRGLVPYTVQHLSVLELAGKFPRRIRIGDNRSVWLEREVRDWLNVRIIREQTREDDDV